MNKLITVCVIVVSMIPSVGFASDSAVMGPVTGQNFDEKSGPIYVSVSGDSYPPDNSVSVQAALGLQAPLGLPIQVPIAVAQNEQPGSPDSPSALPRAVCPAGHSLRDGVFGGAAAIGSDSSGCTHAPRLRALSREMPPYFFNQSPEMRQWAEEGQAIWKRIQDGSLSVDERFAAYERYAFLQSKIVEQMGSIGDIGERGVLSEVACDIQAAFFADHRKMRAEFQQSLSRHTTALWVLGGIVGGGALYWLAKKFGWLEKTTEKLKSEPKPANKQQIA
jgi:hypothetical protein